MLNFEISPSGSSTKGLRAIVVPDSLMRIKGVQLQFSGRAIAGFDSLCTPLTHTLNVRSVAFNLKVSLAKSFMLKSKLKYWLLFLSFTPTVKDRIVWGTNNYHQVDPVLNSSESSASWKRSELEVRTLPQGLTARWVVVGVAK